MIYSITVLLILIIKVISKSEWYHILIIYLWTIISLLLTCYDSISITFIIDYWSVLSKAKYFFITISKVLILSSTSSNQYPSSLPSISSTIRTKSEHYHSWSQCLTITKLLFIIHNYFTTNLFRRSVDSMDRIHDNLSHRDWNALE